MKPTPLYKAGAVHTIHTLITELVEKVELIEEIYMVVKDKDGNFEEVLCGDLAGLGVSIAVLQKYMMEHI